MTTPPPPPSWTEVRVTVPEGWEELIAGLFADSPFTGVAHGPSSLASAPPPEGASYLRAYVPTGRDGEAFRDGLRARLDDLAERAGIDELRGLPLRFHPLPAEDWAESWRKTWKPFRCGRLAVVPTHFDGALRPDDLRLVLDPGGVFGTGRHATTRTCLLALQDAIVLGAAPRVLDAGTGTGILAVAAALLGAREVLGFDLDPSAASHFAELAGRNGVADRCAFREGGFEVLGPADAGYDLVIANIYSDVIAAHAAELAGRLAPGGTFLFSGCPRHHAAATRAAIGAAGLAVEEERVRGLWHTFVGRRRPA